MVRHNDSVDSLCDRFLCILRTTSPVDGLNNDLALNATHRNALDAFQHDRPIPVVPDELQVLPRPENARVHLAEPFLPQQHLRRHTFVALLKSRFPDLCRLKRERGSLGFARFETEPLHEHWIGRADLDANPVSEREIRGFNVVRTPAKDHRVERDDERRKPVGSYSFQQREDDFRGTGPRDTQEQSVVRQRQHWRKNEITNKVETICGRSYR